ncbi:hypothetical protein PVAP13_1NG310019 [Panicum virgatum]|uniref:Uncharacterized protein n=1 Tax=Panicum virgatum TaxID=38727 RepID=A0A8T0X1J6_PANVG|nr:hypothetical protein PVAP13_1NG310019 [Panicum virgatum]
MHSNLLMVIEGYVCDISIDTVVLHVLHHVYNENSSEASTLRSIPCIATCSCS